MQENWVSETTMCLLHGQTSQSEHVQSILSSLSGMSIEEFLAKDLKSLESTTRVPISFLAPIKKAIAAELFPGFCGIEKLADLETICEEETKLLEITCPVGELSEAVSASDEATRFCVLESLKCARSMVENQIDKYVLYIDTNLRFDPLLAIKIMKDSLELEEVHAQKLFKKILVLRDIANLVDLSNFLEHQCELTKDGDVLSLNDFKMIIIDCFANIATPVLGLKIDVKKKAYKKSGVNGHALMINLGLEMKRLAINHKISFIVTNSVVLDWEASAQISENSNDKEQQLKPALGNNWTAIPHHRFLIDEMLNAHNA